MADFKVLKEQVTIEAAAQMLQLILRSTGAAMRGPCPACGTGGDRALVITPAKQLFYCFSAGIGGDLVSLWGHIEKCSLAEAGRHIADTFGIGNSETSAPKSTVHRSQADSSPNEKREPTRQFNPDDYAAKLTYTDEVAALGISEADAKELGIGYSASGMHKGIAFALRYETGEIACFASVIGGEVKLPKRLIPRKVVALRRA